MEKVKILFSIFLISKNKFFKSYKKSNKKQYYNLGGDAITNYNRREVTKYKKKKFTNSINFIYSNDNYIIIFFNQRYF